jgi:hypothetical protein
VLRCLQKRMNLTKTVRKVPISLDFERMGAAMEDTHKTGPKYDDESTVVGGWAGPGAALAGVAAGVYGGRRGCRKPAGWLAGRPAGWLAARVHTLHLAQAVLAAACRQPSPTKAAVVLVMQATYQNDIDLSTTLSHEAFEAALARYPIGGLQRPGVGGWADAGA